jgi:hypothetical protein
VGAYALIRWNRRPAIAPNQLTRHPHSLQIAS